MARSPMTRAHDQQGNLLPCPFCGGKDITEREQETHNGPYVWLICEDCYVETGGEIGRDACYAAWNRRALSPPMTSPALYGAPHQPWCQPGDQPNRAFRLRFEDPDMREMVWTGPDAETEAFAAYNQYAPAWNVYLFSSHPRLTQTSPAAGAVERERVARIIDPDAFEKFEDEWPKIVRERVDARKAEAYAKADAILSALSLVGGETTPPD